MSRARELAKVGGKNQQVVAGLSSHVGVSTFASDVFMYSNLEVTGTTTFNGGTLTLGDANTDNIVFGGEVDSHIIPDDDGTYNLGSATKEWNNLFVDGTANIDALLADTAKIGDLTDNRVVIAGSSGELEDSGNLTFDGSILTTTNVVVTGDTDLGNATSDTITATGRFDSDLVPSSDNARDLGASGLEWKDLYIDGTANIDTLVADTAKVSDLTSGRVVLAGTSGEIEDSGNLTFNGSTLAVTGSQTISVSLDVDGHTDLDNMGVSGVGTITQLVSTTATVGAGLTVTGTIDGNGGANISGAETILSSATVSDLTNNRVVIAGSSGALEDSGNLTFDGSTLAVTGSQTISGNIDVDGTSNLDAVDIDGAVDMASSLTLAGNADFNGNLDVDGTTNLDGTNIAGALAVSGSATVDNLSLDGNTITTSSGNLTIDSNGGTTTINDNAIISGNLTVNGTTTTINSTTVNIDDKNFQVATGAADDAAADGAGFTVDSGDGDKTWNFEATGDNWGSSENINLASGKVLKVNNTSILSSTTLGSSVVTSSLTSLGTIGTGVWQGTAINDTYLGTIDNANKVSLSALNIDGGTDIGAALVDADEIIVDDGGGGTNRRSDMSRVKTYIYGAMSGDATASSGGAVTLAASGVSAGTVGSSTAIPIITVDAKGRITNTSTTAIDSTTIENGSASVAVASNGPITSTGNHDFTAGIDVTGNITVSGTVDGRDVASDGSKLDGIESGATADQSANEILTLIKTVDGSGSGLDADTLDGISSASFLRSDTSDTFSGTLTVSGNILPNANGTRDLGASGTRWANVYSSDLDLSNEAKGGNTIDGSWGSYLIEEGEEHLYLTNRRSGKKYKFMLEEV